MSSSAPVDSWTHLSVLEYDALPNATSIRVLEIVESTPDKILCNMRVVDLDQDPAFVTLSCACDEPGSDHQAPVPSIAEDADGPSFMHPLSTPGSDNEEDFINIDGKKLHSHLHMAQATQRVLCGEETIEVNGCPVSIDENLFQCLSTLAKWKHPVSLGTMEVPVWVDTLCINHSDLSEKAAQVQLSARIFSSAVRSLIWIGQDAGLMAGALAAMKDIRYYRAREATRNHDWEPEPPMWQSRITEALWLSILSLFQRLWSRREWVAQEVIFARMSWVVCGEKYQGLSLFTDLVRFLDEQGLGQKLCELGRINSLEHSAKCSKNTRKMSPMEVFQFIRSCQRTRARLEHSILVTRPDFFRFGPNPIRLVTLLSAFRGLETTDARDKILAFLDLARDELGLAPDSHFPVERVFKAAAVAMIRKTQSLSVLSLVEDPKETRIHGLPSWVPDFTARLRGDRFGTGEEDCRFCASGDAFNITTAPSSDGGLEVAGIRLDTISASTDVDPNSPTDVLKLALRVPSNYPGKPRTWCSIQDVRDGMPRRTLRSRAMSRIEALWRTLVADNVTDTDPKEGMNDDLDSLGPIFSLWVRRYLVQARLDLRSHWYDGREDLDRETKKLAIKSFCTQLALWSAIYNGRQTAEFNEDKVSDLWEALDDLNVQARDEIDQYKLDQHLGIKHPTVGIRHFPTANELLRYFPKPVEEDNPEDDYGFGHRSPRFMWEKYDQRAITPRFEHKIRAAPEGRVLFCTRGGRLGLGPQSSGKDPKCKDEVWILQGAKVPFILRHGGDYRYRVVGEAYVHGVMYGERSVRPDEWERIRLV
jgi:hypothetical protein